MKKYVLFVLMTVLFFSCSLKKKKKKENTAAAKMEIMEVDRAFSKLSEQKGLKTAFVEYIDSNGVLLRPNSVPLTEGYAMDIISRSSDTGFTMTWAPKNGAVAASSDLAYTYGVYSYKQNNSDSVVYGTYVTIWKKQPDGKWKFVLQSGNEGVE